MDATTAYTIYHLQLHDIGKSSEDKFTPGNKYYCVVWWESIPLGDLFVERFNGDYPLLVSLMNKTVLCGLKNYSNSLTFTKAACNLPYGDKETLANLCSETLTKLLPVHLPSQVEISVVVCT